MPNKNIKKRRRVVMTSDVVPAGSRGDERAPEVKSDEAEARDASVSPPSDGGEPSEHETQLAKIAKKDRAKRRREETSTTEDRASAGDAENATPPGDEVQAAALRDEPGSEGASVTVEEGASDDDHGSIDEHASGDDHASHEERATRDEHASHDHSISEHAMAAEDASSSDDVTEPGARGDELWTPEESEPPATTVPAADLSRAHLKGLIEALVFVADQPVSLNEIAKAAGRADRKLVKALAEELRQDYARRGIHLDEVAGGLIFRTNPAYAPFIRDVAAKKPVRMTRAQLETLAIIAYRQPLTRPEVDEIRGVDSGPVMKMLLERDLVRILGKKDEPGRPLLYGTTHNFLEFFGLKALKDLPSLREFTELNEDSRRVYDREMGDAPEAATQPDLATLAAAASAVETEHPSDSAAMSGAEESIESSAAAEPDPQTMRPGDVAPEWFERPTEPDTTVEALEPTSQADLDGSEEPDPDEVTAVSDSEPLTVRDEESEISDSDSGESEAQA